MLQDAEDNYYQTANYLLELSKRSYELFIRSKVEQRRQLIKLVLSNITVKDKTVCYDAVRSFDTLLDYADHQLWLRAVDDVQTYFISLMSI